MKYTGDLLIKDLQKKVKALEGTSFTSQWQLFRPEARSYWNPDDNFIYNTTEYSGLLLLIAGFEYNIF